ncbi:hypothetical protein QCM80_33790 [Bradyrhizobium sp. SSUT112]|uniref:hypothetical protein n=1 Tax=Bradyrhizobium sp. SSUT112 TaxID=3040604 RepID=UPI00244B4849|nr:hypothetical protein [Bradyrhizobium sp. SSUT112]MDH2355607.1 hypothetical protein [Bradyrhizobium sp. SSUT112]
MARLLLALMIIVIVSATRQDAVAQDHPRILGPSDGVMKQVDEDMRGPLGKEAISICKRVAGITVPVQTAIDAIRAGYSAAVAVKFSDCVANYMYPMDAKKSEELDRKINQR